MRAVWVLGLLFFLSLKSFAQIIVDVNGKVTDKQGKPLAFTSIWIEDSHEGSLTNENGGFNLKLKPGTYKISFRQLGYEPLFQTITVDDKLVSHDLQLNQKTTSKTLSGIGDSIILGIIAKRKAYMAQIPTYAGHLYTKASQRLNKAPKLFFKKDIAHQLNLNPDQGGIFSLSESIARFHTLSTDYIKEQLDAAKVTSNNEAFNFNSAAELHIDLYQNYQLFNGLSDHAFVSPIANNALKFYRYQLIGQFIDQDKLIDEISVQPRHKSEHVFNGTIYVIDKEWLLYGANLHLSTRAHIDFIDSVRISQQFVPLNDGNWVPQSMNFNFYGKLFGFKYAGYFLQVFQNIGADTTTNRGSYQEVFHSNKDNYQKDNRFWEQNRLLPLLPDEDRFYRVSELAERHKKDKTLADSLQNTNNRFRLLPYLFNGYTLHNYEKSSSWAFPSPYNMVFYNTVEGWGIDLKAKYTKLYENQRTLSIIPDARYGFSDHIFNTNVFVNFTYNPFRQASVYGRIGSDFLDLNNTGTISPFLNSLSTLLLGNNYIKLYQSRFIMGGTDGEIANGILLNGQIEYAERKSLSNSTQHTFNRDSIYLTSNNPLDPNGNTALFPPYRALTFRGSATLTFDQEYKITSAGKFILPNPYPRVRINYREGIPALGSNVNYNFVSVDIFQDKLNMGIYGYTSYFVSAGTFPNTKNLYYPDYNQFMGGESFFFNASLGSFHFLNFYTYSTDRTYFEAHAEHNFTGFFLSHVPLINKLNLQEIIGGSYLTQGTLPDYKEVYIGLKRTVIRLDYGLAFGRFTNRIQGFRLSYNL
jgi:hypothetical protein